MRFHLQALFAPPTWRSAVCLLPSRAHSAAPRTQDRGRIVTQARAAALTSQVGRAGAASSQYRTATHGSSARWGRMNPLRDPLVVLLVIAAAATAFFVVYMAAA